MDLKKDGKGVLNNLRPEVYMRPLASLGVAIFMFLFLPLAAFAGNGASPERKDLSGQISRMTQSVDELVRLLKEEKSQNNRDVELKKLEIAVTYLSFRSRRIEAREDVLREKKRIRDRLAELVAKIREQPEQWEDYYKRPKTVSLSTEEQPSEYRIKLMEERIDILDHDIINLETEIAQLSGELVELESFVQEKLDLIK
jgi:hypothetical protein